MIAKLKIFSPKALGLTAQNGRNMGIHVRNFVHHLSVQIFLHYIL